MKTIFVYHFDVLTFFTGLIFDSQKSETWANRLRMPYITHRKVRVRLSPCTNLQRKNRTLSSWTMCTAIPLCGKINTVEMALFPFPANLWGISKIWQSRSNRGLTHFRDVMLVWEAGACLAAALVAGFCEWNGRRSTKDNFDSNVSSYRNAKAHP